MFSQTVLFYCIWTYRLLKGVPWPLTSRYVNENRFYGYPRVSPLQTCPLYDNHMQFGASHSQVSTLTHWQLLLSVGLQFAMLWFEHIFMLNAVPVRVSGQYLSLFCVVNWFPIINIYIHLHKAAYLPTPMLIKSIKYLTNLPLRYILNRKKKCVINLQLIVINYGQSCN